MVKMPNKMIFLILYTPTRIKSLRPKFVLWKVLDQMKAYLIQKMDIQTPEGDGNCGIEDDQQTRDIRTDQHSNE